MKRVVEIIMVVFFSFLPWQHTFAKNTIFSIEDKDLVTVDESDGRAITSDSSFLPFKELGCSLVGKSIPVSVRHNSLVSFITTADGCGWGAALGPIWILSKSSNARKIVLSSGGNSIEILPKSSREMFDISVDSERSGNIHREFYRFDGSQYVRHKK